MNKNRLKQIIPVELGLLGTISICYFIIQRFNIGNYGNILLLFPIFFILIKLFKETIFTETRRELLICGLMGFCYAMALGVGIYSEKGNIFLVDIVNSSVYILGTAIVFTYLIIWTFRKIQHFQYTSGAQTGYFTGNIYFIWTLIFLSWIPWLLIWMPGIYVYDVPMQLQQFFTENYSAHHPICHTLYLGICIKLGLLLFNSSTAGAVLHSISQMIIMSGIFSYTAIVLYEKFRIHKYAFWLIIVFFMIYPLNPVYSFTATKDVLFAGFFLLTIILLIESLCSKSARNSKWIYFILSAVLMMLFRNNGLHAFILFLAIFIPTVKNKSLVFSKFIIVIIAYICISQSLLLITDASKPNLREMLSVPIQQVARAIRDEKKKISLDELSIVFEILSKDSIENKYKPTLSDPVKGSFNQYVFKLNPIKYIKTYLAIGLKCPTSYFNAFFDLTLPYWYPYIRSQGSLLHLGIRTSRYEWAKNNKFENVKMHAVNIFPKARSAFSTFVKNKQHDKVPLIGLFFNMGFICWLYFYILGYVIYTNNNTTMPFILSFCLWITCLLGPVALSRYLYPVIVSIPPMAALAFRPSYEKVISGLDIHKKFSDSPYSKRCIKWRTIIVTVLLFVIAISVYRIDQPITINKKKDAQHILTTFRSLKSLNLITARIDIRNIGSDYNDVKVDVISDSTASIRRMSWIKKGGDGQFIESAAGTLSTRIVCKGDGKLRIDLRGRDVRGKDGKRIPYWIDYTTFSINGTPMLAEHKTVWHDKPHTLFLEVKDNDIVEISAKWRPASEAEAEKNAQSLTNQKTETEKALKELEALKKQNKKLAAQISSMQNSDPGRLRDQ